MACYFLRLGALGFGGPVALADAMRRDLVETRRWLTEAEYETGLAIAASCPGPLAYQLAVYCGYVRFGLSGALNVAVCFRRRSLLPGTGRRRSLHHAQLERHAASAVLWRRARRRRADRQACWSLGTKTLRRDPAAWTLATVACIITITAERELTVIFVAWGALGAFLLSPRGPAAAGTAPPPKRDGRLFAFAPIGIVPLASSPLATTATLSLFLFFFKTGCLVFGSGLVIVPFLKAYVVDQYQWLDDRTFLDAVAVGMISPGPVVITATFVGFMVGGASGALAATLGIFSPAVLFTVGAAPLFHRHGRHPRLHGFVRGVTVAVVGVLAGTTSLVARTAIGDRVHRVCRRTGPASPRAPPSLSGPRPRRGRRRLGPVAYPWLRPEWVLR